MGQTIACSKVSPKSAPGLRLPVAVRAMLGLVCPRIEEENMTKGHLQFLIRPELKESE